MSHMPPPQTSNGHSYSPQPEQYDFILNAGPKRSSPLAGSSNSSRLLIALGGALLLIIVAAIFLSLIRRSPHADTSQLISIAQQQGELARISLAATSNDDAQSTRNFAKTTQLNLQTEQQLFQAYLTNHGAKINKKALEYPSAKSAQTDAVLTNAKTNGDYDSVFISTAQSELTAYERALAQTYQSAQLLSEKRLLQKAFSEATLLQDFSNQR